MNKKFFAQKFCELTLKVFLPATGITAAVMAAVVPFSCKSPVEALNFLEGDFSAPVLESVSVQDENTISLVMSKEVNVQEALVSPIDSQETAVSTEEEKAQEPAASVFENESDTYTVSFTLPTPMETGRLYSLRAILQDRQGNTLTLTVPFTGYNNRMPYAVLSEIRHTKFTKTVSGQTVAYYPFVELYMLQDGNLSGMELAAASSAGTFTVKLPPIEVHRGQYVTVHICPQGAALQSETEDSLSAASGTDTCSTALDLYAETDENTKFLATSDVLLLRDSNSGKIFDALLYYKSTKTMRYPYEDVLSQIQEENIWLNKEGECDCSIENAVCIDAYTTVNRSLSRQNNAQLLETFTNNPEEFFPFSTRIDQWLLTDKVKNTSSSTPGFANSTNPYVKK